MIDYEENDPNILARVLFIVFGGTALGLVLFLCVILIYGKSYDGRIYRGVSVGDVDLSGMSAAEAAETLNGCIRYPFAGNFGFRYQDRVWYASPEELGFNARTDEMTAAAMRIGREGSAANQITERIAALLRGTNLEPTYLFDERVAFNYITKIAEEIDEPMEDPSILLQGSEVVIVPGKSGRRLDREMTMHIVQIYARNLQAADIDLPVSVLEPTTASLEEQTRILTSLLSRDFELYTNDDRGILSAGTIPADVLAGLIHFEPVVNDGNVSINMTPKTDVFYSRLLEIGNTLYQEAQDARYHFNEYTGELELIQAPVSGREIDIDASLANIAASIRDGANQAEVVMTLKAPNLSGTETAAELGIRELVHTENTYFFYSDDARIQNIQVGAGKLDGVLIAPGETFSMAKAVGEVSKETGYAESSVIFGSETVQDVGGGLCQVSTTLFRAAFNYGLEIDERHAHGYRVYYYERLANRQLDPGLAGLDAAVYLPDLDLKFTNDTPYWILMETDVNVELCRLQWRFYSTDVKRYVDYTSSGLTNIEPEGDPIYNENPDLPAGVIEQVDWGIDGADVTITRTVYENGLIHINDVFETHYAAWSDIFEYGPGTEGIPVKDESDGEGGSQSNSY